MIDLASLYRTDIPLHENTEYIERAKELREEMDLQMTSGKNAFTTRIDRGWSPPTPEDAEALIKANEEKSTG